MCAALVHGGLIGKWRDTEEATPGGNELAAFRTVHRLAAARGLLLGLLLFAAVTRADMFTDLVAAQLDDTPILLVAGKPTAIIPGVTVDVRVDQLTAWAPEIHFLFRNEQSDPVEYIVDARTFDVGFREKNCWNLRLARSPLTPWWRYTQPWGALSGEGFAGSVDPSSWSHLMLYAQLGDQVEPCYFAVHLELTLRRIKYTRVLAVHVDRREEDPPGGLFEPPEHPQLHVVARSSTRGSPQAGSLIVIDVLMTSDAKKDVTVTGGLIRFDCSPQGGAWVAPPSRGVEFAQLSTGPITVPAKGWAPLTYAFKEVRQRPQGSKCSATIQVSTGPDDSVPEIAGEVTVEF